MGGFQGFQCAPVGFSLIDLPKGSCRTLARLGLVREVRPMANGACELSEARSVVGLVAQVLHTNLLFGLKGGSGDVDLSLRSTDPKPHTSKYLLRRYLDPPGTHPSPTFSGLVRLEA